MPEVEKNENKSAALIIAYLRLLADGIEKGEITILEFYNDKLVSIGCRVDTR